MRGSCWDLAGILKGSCSFAWILRGSCRGLEGILPVCVDLVGVLQGSCSLLAAVLGKSRQVGDEYRKSFMQPRADIMHQWHTPRRNHPTLRFCRRLDMLSRRCNQTCSHWQVRPYDLLYYSSVGCHIAISSGMRCCRQCRHWLHTCTGKAQVRVVTFQFHR